MRGILQASCTHGVEGRVGGLDHFLLIVIGLTCVAGVVLVLLSDDVGIILRGSVLPTAVSHVTSVINASKSTATSRTSTGGAPAFVSGGTPEGGDESSVRSYVGGTDLCFTTHRRFEVV